MDHRYFRLVPNRHRCFYIRKSWLRFLIASIGIHCYIVASWRGDIYMECNAISTQSINKAAGLAP